ALCLTDPLPAGEWAHALFMGGALFLDRPGVRVSYPGGAGVGRSQV
ncbi:saccharopine dehydrogenase, partial [Burkholderia multivorans]